MKKNLSKVTNPQLTQFIDDRGIVYTVIPEGFNRFTVMVKNTAGKYITLVSDMSDTDLLSVWGMSVPIEILPDNPEIKTGMYYISKERERQIHEEGFTIEGDKLYEDEQLAFAAATYALPEVVNKSRTFKRIHLWPWASQWWKPSTEDRIKELAKAGALIAAEIDRLKAIK